MLIKQTKNDIVHIKQKTSCAVHRKQNNIDMHSYRLDMHSVQCCCIFDMHSKQCCIVSDMHGVQSYFYFYFLYRMCTMLKVSYLQCIMLLNVCTVYNVIYFIYTVYKDVGYAKCTMLVYVSYAKYTMYV